MKSILQSYTPKEIEQIATGKQTIKICKTAPKDTPFKVYIYCTQKGRPLVFAEPSAYCTDAILHRTYGWNKKEADRVFGIWNGKVVGEYVCDRIYVRPANVLYFGKGKEDYLDLIKSSCMTEMKVLDYMGGQFNKNTYFLHISDLKIYDKPKELSEFRVVDKDALKECEYRKRAGQPEDKTCHNGWIKGTWLCIKSGEYDWCENCKTKNIQKPPRSWMYVEELK